MKEKTFKIINKDGVQLKTKECVIVICVGLTNLLSEICYLRQYTVKQIPNIIDVFTIKIMHKKLQ